MSDFSFVTERLAVGAALQSQSDVEAIVAAGITHVIDCRKDFNDTASLACHRAVTVLWDGTADDGQPKPPAWFRKGIEFALYALAQPHHKIYVHCAAGVNRGPSMAYAILRAQGLQSTTAERLIRTARPIVGLRYKADADRAVSKLGYGRAPSLQDGFATRIAFNRNQASRFQGIAKRRHAQAADLARKSLAAQKNGRPVLASKLLNRSLWLKAAAGRATARARLHRNRVAWLLQDRRGQVERPLDNDK